MDYEKILKEIIQIINTTENSDIGFTNICTYIGENCPELQKSEDERIRKELIDYINRLTVTPNNIDRYNSWIAWLEKQGKHKDYYTKKELIDMGFSFTLNGDIVTPDEMMEDMKKYLAWKEKQGKKSIDDLT